MTLTVFIFFIVLAFTIYQIAAIILNQREINRYRDISGRQDCQQRFGVLRQELIKTVGNEQLSSNSIVFLELYRLNTTVMRHPDKYKRIAAGLRDGFLADHKRDHEFLEAINRESPGWTPEFRNLIKRHSDELNYLMIRHSPFVRVLFLFIKLMKKFLGKIIPILVKRITHSTMVFVGSISEANKTVLAARDELRHLAVH